ncbi:protein CyaE [Desulfosarcina ovata subsp. sediminis]|uniref:Protein CyaE n=1 Tax=Desulfosarcina ovata subsp. sediminis TaxID=885957 RepID=A0A5K7ZVP8_9BACT|nr:TolC family protein [Desulfosarcina ovata]BBO84319.1 protein CyaE [Desulfosarcina ovata subsp. sediminis]
MADFDKMGMRFFGVILLAGVLCSAWAMAAEPVPQPLSMNRAVALAAANNRLVREAIQNGRAAEAAYRSARADLFAKASAGYSYTRFKEQPYMWVEGYTVDTNLGTITGLRNYQKTTSDKDLVEWNLTLTQPLFTGFALTTRLKMAELGMKSSQVEETIAVQDVVKQAKLAVINVLLAEKLLTVAVETEKSIAAHARNAENFYDQGLIPYNDQLQANVALADAIQQRVAQAARREMAVAALNSVLDLPIGHPTRVAELAEGPVAAPDDPEMLMDLAIRRRPELKALDLGRQKLVQGRVLARSAYYPTINLVGQYRQKGEDWAATDNSYDNPHNALVGVQAQWTFFEWGKTRSEEARVRHEIEALDEKINGVKQALRLETKDAFIRLQVARENVRTANAALDQARENLRIVNTRYAQQMATSTDVLDANTKQTRARANYFGAVYGCHSALAELERAVGQPLTADLSGTVQQP